MRLKKIIMTGFKSFADRTVIEFDAGITGIVGPNGCGKSNVSDAFRWVLGEQSAKSMRGDKMADVVFAGSGKRKASPFAEVVLTFNEVGDALPIEYEEVSVSRRLYRNGNSEYRLNGNLVRLKEIHSLFWDTGLGKDSLAIFEQGKIEEVIVRSPLDRRPIFESAAGILRFRIRRKEARAKLDKMDGNLSRVEDLAGEVSRQMKQLEAQVEQAREYRKNKAELDLLEKGVMRAKVVRAEETETRECERRKKLDERLLVKSKSAESAKEKVKARQEKFREQQEFLFQARSEIEVARAQRQSVEQQLKQLDQQLAKWQGELELLKKQRASLVFEEEGDLEERVKLAERHFVASRKSSDEFEKAMHKSREGGRAAQEAKMESVRREHAVASQLRELQVRLESGSEQLEQIEGRRDQIEAKCSEIRTLLGEKQERLSALSSRVDQLKAEVVALDGKLDERRGEMALLESQIEGRKEDMAEARAKERAHQMVAEESSPGAKRLMERGAKPLMKVMRPKAAHAALLQPYGETLWVESLDDLSSLVAFAKAEGIVGFSITSPELAGKKGEGLARAKLVEKIDFEGLGTLTKEGNYLDEKGVFFSPAGSERSVVVRDAEIAQLQKLLAKGEKAQESDLGKLEKLKSKVAELEAQRKERDLAHRQEEMRLVEVNFSLQRAKGDLETLEKEKEQSKERHAKVAGGQKELSASIDKLKVQQVKAQEALVAAQATAQEADQLVEKRLEELQSRRGSLQECERSFRRLSEELHQQRAQRRLVEAKLQALDRHEAKCKRDLAEAQEQRAELASHVALKAGAGSTQSEEERCKAAEERLEEERTRLRKLEEEVQRLKVEREQVDGRVQQSRSALESVRLEASERFELTGVQLKQMDLPTVESIKESERQIHQLRRQLESASNVNLGAVEEYEELKTRNDFLTEQVDDLHGSKKELLEIITQLEKRSRKQFRETFEEVRAGFKRTFQLLFEGGEADLKFTESSDVLEAGIEIVAQPPGKAMRSISLLSGGEKCLTALALLFAIFEVNPSPVCILDETDAPLDDTNVGRFLRVLDAFLEKTQVIMITHNKKTMEACSVLIGVTMQERGVSKPIEMRMTAGAA